MEPSNNGIDGFPAAANLPQDIIFYNILTRVPDDKSLNQIRCVCKQWYNLRHDPLFRSSYLHHSFNNITSSAYNERGFICCEEDYFVHGNSDKYFSFLDIDKKKSKRIPFQLPEDNYGYKISMNGANMSVKDSFNGVLLLRFEIHCAHSNRYYVYNPASGGWVLITTHSDFGDLDFRMCDYSLAYDPIISRYKVVGYDEETFYIFTVGEDHSWRCVLKPPEYLHILGKPVYVNNAFHWICRETDSEDVLRFDVIKEAVSTIKLPVEGSWASRCLLEMEGLLGFIHSDRDDSYPLKLWYLKKKNHNADHEWVAKCSINLDSVFSSQQPISFLGGYSWNREPVFIVTDPIFKIIFTFVDRKDGSNRYTYSYDMELKHWDLIHAWPSVCYEKKRRYATDFDEQEFHYWYDNKKALSTYVDCDWYFPAYSGN